MTMIATKLGVGIAGCAIAAASLLTVAPAEAAPVTVPAAPVVLGPGNVPLKWGHGGGGDFIRDFIKFEQFLDHCKPYHCRI
jgi:hypothetical protein